MGGTERVAKHHDKGKLDVRARIDRLLDQGSFREIGTLVGGEIAADGIVVGSGLRQRLAHHGRRRGLHHAGGQHRSRRQLQALPHRRTRGAQPDSVGDAVGGRRFPAHRWPLRPHSHRPARAGELLGARPHRRRRPRPVGRARCTGRPGLRLQDHEPPGCDLHRGSARRQGVDGRGDLEGGPRRSRASRWRAA